MKNGAELAKVLSSGHTTRQKINYLRYFFSPKSEVLRYGPLTLSIVATSRCTLACDMCPTHSRLVSPDYEHRQKTKIDMGFAMFKGVIDTFNSALTVHIIGSGEPLLNKDLFAMIEYAARRKMVVKTITNGTLLASDEIRQKILASPLEGITVSINGHDRREFSRMTGMDPAVYDAIYRNVRELVARKKRHGSPVKVKLSFILDRENMRFTDAMIRTALELGVDHTFFCNFLGAPFDGLRPEERVLFMEDAGDILRSVRGKLTREEKMKFTFPPLLKKKRLAPACDTHFTQIRVDGEGHVSSCSMMLLNMEHGGTYRAPDPWNGESFRTMRRTFMGTGEKLPDPCYHCVSNYGVSF